MCGHRLIMIGWPLNHIQTRPLCTMPHPFTPVVFEKRNSNLSTLQPPHTPCCRSVSVVPPAYYVQLAADRGQILAQGRELLGEHGAAAAAGTGSTSSSAEGAAAAAEAAAVSGGESVGGAAAPGLIVHVDVLLCSICVQCAAGVLLGVLPHVLSVVVQLYWFCPVAAWGRGVVPGAAAAIAAVDTRCPVQSFGWPAGCAVDVVSIVQSTSQQ